LHENAKAISNKKRELHFSFRKRLIDETFRANICVCFVVSSHCFVFIFFSIARQREAKRKEDVKKNRPTGHICQSEREQKDLYEKLHL
jgi:hypothetical protein